MTDRELMQQALEGLEKWRWGSDPRGADVYIDALRGRVEQLKPLRPWVGLTDEEIDHAAEQSDNYASFTTGALFAQDKLKEKNR